MNYEPFSLRAPRSIPPAVLRMIEEPDVIELDPEDVAAWFQDQQDRAHPARIFATAAVTMVFPFVLGYAIVRHVWRRHPLRRNQCQHTRQQY